MNRSKTILRCDRIGLSLFVSALLLISPLHINADSEIKKSIVIGCVSDNPKKNYKKFKPMADYLAAHLKDLGIVEGRILLAADADQLVRYMREGKVDLVSESAFMASYLRDNAGAEPLLLAWRKGVPKYHTVFFVRTDSGINTLADLNGKTIAFEDMRSTSAYMIPASILLREGLQLVQLDSPRDTPPPDKVGYVFSGEEINSTMLVHKGIVHAAAFSNLDWASDDDLPKAIREDMKIIYKTNSFPRAVEIVRKDLDPDIKQRIKTLLLDAHKHPDVAPILKSYRKVTQFSLLDESDHSGLDEVAKLAAMVGKAQK